MADDRRIADEVLDLVVYAPVGALLTLVEDLPELARKGRSRLQAQLLTARSIGHLAVTMGNRRVKDVIRPKTSNPHAAGPAKDSSSETDTQARPARAARATGGAQAASDHSGPGVDQVDGRLAGQHQVEGQPAEGEPAHADAAPASAPRSAGPVASLAIPGYDSLAASQVVQRLAGLTPQELRAVEAYEQATRGRRTILGRISQLSGTAGEARRGPQEGRGGA